MTNKERYKQAFSTLHTSSRLSLEVEEMALLQKKRKNTIAAAAIAACALIIGGSGTAYAADIGGIQEKLSMWFHGTQTKVEVSDNETGGYTFRYQTQDGAAEFQGAGGVSINEDGSTTALSAGELLDTINQYAMVETDENGAVWAYYYDQILNITDLFDENDTCRLLLSHNGTFIYLKVTREQDGSCSYSQHTEPLDGEAAENYLYIVIEGTSSAPQ